MVSESHEKMPDALFVQAVSVGMLGRIVQLRGNQVYAFS